jgi:hypothetical protein
MKKLLIVAATLLMTSAAYSQTSQPQTSQQDFGLPELHKIKTANLSPSYSCRSKEDFQKGYRGAALFLSDYSKKRNSPDLLFNGACGSENYFQASTAGADMALIADLGEVALEDASAHLAFYGKADGGRGLSSNFATAAKVEANHTYAVLLNKSDLRGLFIFTVVDYVRDRKVDLKYAVKQYQVLDVKTQSAGFDWAQKSQQD